MNRRPSNRRPYFTYIAGAGLAILVAACGGTAKSAPEAPRPDGIQSTAGQPVEEAGTEAPQEVTIVTHDSMRFEPAALTVQAGRPVRLTVRNQGQAVHDFSLSKGVARSVKLVVKGGQSAEATFTIARPGHLRVHLFPVRPRHVRDAGHHHRHRSRQRRRPRLERWLAPAAGL
jgi:plastocyanin